MEWIDDHTIVLVTQAMNLVPNSAHTVRIHPQLDIDHRFSKQPTPTEEQPAIRATLVTVC